MTRYEATDVSMVGPEEPEAEDDAIQEIPGDKMPNLVAVTYDDKYGTLWGFTHVENAQKVLVDYVRMENETYKYDSPMKGYDVDEGTDLTEWANEWVEGRAEEGVMEAYNYFNDDKSELERALDDARDASETEWRETTITEKINVTIPKENALDLIDSAEVTWDASEHDRPRRHQEAPKRSLKEYVAETVAKDKFLDRHDVKHRSDIDAHAQTRGHHSSLKRDGKRISGEEWEVVLYL